mmetsp:Transcript_6944/g.21238  ORF Transcript_6944/g.21238 Transcript_6944/m.21238 type:complete len:225 (+) Transcript_6944:603-1277(+)|eukprot:scaffold201726_cov32-Tisochrysis_lutea.AAC.3
MGVVPARRSDAAGLVPLLLPLLLGHLLLRLLGGHARTLIALNLDHGRLNDSAGRVHDRSLGGRAWRRLRARRLDSDRGAVLGPRLDDLTKAATAKALSVCGRSGRSGACARDLNLNLWGHLPDDEGGSGGDDVVREPVEAEAGRNAQRKPADHQRQKLEDSLRLLLSGVLALWRQKLHGEILGGDEQDRKHEVGTRDAPPILWRAVHPVRQPANALGVVSHRAL